MEDKFVIRNQDITSGIEKVMIYQNDFNIIAEYLDKLSVHYESLGGKSDIQLKMSEYIKEVYGKIKDSSMITLEGYKSSLLTMSSKFKNEVNETNIKFVLDESRLEDICAKLEGFKTSYSDSLGKVSAIVEEISSEGVTEDHVFDKHVFESNVDEIKTFVDNVKNTTEAINTDTAFIDQVNELSINLRHFINSCMSNINIGTFDVSQLNSDPSFRNLINSYNKVIGYIEQCQDAVIQELRDGNFAAYLQYKQYEIERNQLMWKILGTVIGAVVTLATFGFGSVLGLCIVASNFISIAFDASELTERTSGMNKVGVGDWSPANNFFLDIVFNGNEQAYNNVVNTNEVIGDALGFLSGFRGKIRKSSLAISSGVRVPIYTIPKSEVVKQVVPELLNIPSRNEIICGAAKKAISAIAGNVDQGTIDNAVDAILGNCLEIYDNRGKLNFKTEPIKEGIYLTEPSFYASGFSVGDSSVGGRNTIIVGEYEMGTNYIINASSVVGSIDGGKFHLDDNGIKNDPGAIDVKLYKNQEGFFIHGGF